MTADGSGAYSFQVPTDWSGTVTPSKAGYEFSPSSMSYTNVLSDQTEQNYTTTGVMVTISGNAGHAGVTLSYTDGTPKTVTADENGLYSLEVSYNWSGMVTPSLSGYGFIPGTRTYTNVIVNQYAQDYITNTGSTYYVDKTNPACTDVGQVGSFAVPFCTITGVLTGHSPVRSCMSCMARMQRQSIPSAAARLGIRSPIWQTPVLR